MSPQEPVPSPVPSPVPNPIGPSLSYSSVRAATTRAEGTLDGLQRKVSKALQGQLDAAGRVGAMAETRVLTRLSDALAPAEQLFDELDDQIKNQLAAGMAPAVATLQDLGEVTEPAIAMGISAGATPQRATAVPGETAAPGILHGAGVSANSGSVTVGPAPPRLSVPNRRPVIVRPPAVQPQMQCTPPDEPESDRLKSAAIAFRNTLPVRADEIYQDYEYLGNVDCCVCISRVNQPDCPQVGSFLLFFAGPPLQASMVTPMRNYLQNLWQPKANCGQPPPPVDCNVHPTDPSCPIDCVANPSDPRCIPCPPTDCCITNVTCPPTEVIVQPCQPAESFPACVYVDLCDYDKFCDLLKKCLVTAKEDCALDNETAYLFSDCDGRFGQALDDWWGEAGKSVAEPATYDDLIAAASNVVGNFDGATFAGPDPFGLLGVPVPV